MSQKQNNDFKYLIQIPNFLSPEKCDELLKDIMESEQDVTGCVGDEQGKNAVIPEIRKTNEWYLCEQKDNEFRPDNPNKDWKWLQDKMFQIRLMNVEWILRTFFSKRDVIDLYCYISFVVLYIYIININLQGIDLYIYIYIYNP